MTRVMAIDAGQSTGVAIIDFPDDKPLKVQHIEQFKMPIADTAKHLDHLSHVYRAVVPVAERFDLRPGNNFLADLTTVEINGALKYAWGEGAIFWQTPAQAKSVVTNDVLKRLDLWITGKDVDEKDADDARDALRHAIHYGVVALRHLPTISVAWPKPLIEED